VRNQRRRPAARSSSVTTARCSPELASRWTSPLAASSSSLSRESPLRSPTASAVTNAARSGVLQMRAARSAKRDRRSSTARQSQGPRSSTSTTSALPSTAMPRERSCARRSRPPGLSRGGGWCTWPKKRARSPRWTGIPRSRSATSPSRTRTVPTPTTTPSNSSGRMKGLGCSWTAPRRSPRARPRAGARVREISNSGSGRTASQQGEPMPRYAPARNAAHAARSGRPIPDPHVCIRLHPAAHEPAMLRRGCDRRQAYP